MSTKPDDRCTLCGGNGHTRSDCPWPRARVSRGRRIGWTGYAEIIAALIAAPESAQSLSVRFGYQLQTMRRVLNRLHTLRSVHVTAWDRKARGAAFPFYAWGKGADVPSPTPRPGVKPDKISRSSALPELVQVVAILRAMSGPDPVSITQLAEETGSNWGNIRRLVHHCHEIGIAHIGGWEHRPGGGGPPARLFSFGAGKDIPRPKPIPRSVIEKRSREARQQRARMVEMIRATAANGPMAMEAA